MTPTSSGCNTTSRPWPACTAGPWCCVPRWRCCSGPAPSAARSGCGAGVPTAAPHAAAARLVVLVIGAQAAVGYLQYFTGVPVLLVGIHIAGAAALWTVVLRLHLAVHEAPAR